MPEGTQCVGRWSAQRGTRSTPAPLAAATAPVPGSIRACRRRSSSLIAPQRWLASDRDASCRLSGNAPCRVRPQMCVNPRKLNVSGLPSPRACSMPRRVAAELDQSGLVRMQRQRELLHPLAHLRQESLGIGQRARSRRRCRRRSDTIMTCPRAWRWRHCCAHRSKT